MVNKFVKVGLPMITLLVGGSFGLSYMVQQRYETKPTFVPEELRAVKKETRDFDLEDEYKRMMDKLGDIDNYVNKKIERPKDR